LCLQEERPEETAKETAEESNSGWRVHSGHPEQLCTPYHDDSRPVEKFKSRALKRHAKFNGYIKSFAALEQHFQHPEDRFADVFKPACVICQYQLDAGDKYLLNTVVQHILHDY
jgi:hypothetical protein